MVPTLGAPGGRASGSERRCSGRPRLAARRGERLLVQAVRLDTYISQATNTSIKEASKAIREPGSRVKVAGRTVKASNWQVFSGYEDVELDGQAVAAAQPHVLLVMNKGRGSVCSNQPPEGARSVMDDVPPALASSSLHPVGRLDANTTGILLLGTDKGIANMLLHPNTGVAKTYEVLLKADTLEEGAEGAFAAGVLLAGGVQCRPARLERAGHAEGGEERVLVTLHEGKFHQVKKMVEACGGWFVAMRRVRFGPLELDPSLGEGQCREATEEEARALLAALPACRLPPQGQGVPGEETRRLRKGAGG